MQMKTVKTNVALVMFGSLVAVAGILSICTSPSVAGDSFYYDIIAKTGDLGIASFGQGISINARGTVAFVGRFVDSSNKPSGQAIFSFHGGAGPLLNNTPNSDPTRTFDPAVQINYNVQDQTEGVICRQHELFHDGVFCMCDVPIDLLREYDANGSNVYFQYEKAPRLYIHGNFDGIFPYPAISNKETAVSQVFNDDQQSDGSYVRTRYLERGLRNNDFVDLYAIGPAPNDRRMVVADNDTFVLRTGASPWNLTLRNMQYNTISTIASSTNFSYIGLSPGISDDGSTVVFYGEPTADAKLNLGLDAHPGIFVWRNNKVYRVAGKSGNDSLDPGETYTDMNRNGKFDIGENDAGPIGGFYPDERICVNNFGSVLFLASEVGSANQALFISRFNGPTSQPTVSDPVVVVQQNDVLPSVAGSVQHIVLHDSLDDSLDDKGNPGGAPGNIAFWADMGGGVETVVRARVKVHPIIFVAGMAASDLYFGSTLDPAFRVWPAIGGDALGSLSLAPGEPNRDIVPVDVTRTYSPPIGATLNVYNVLLNMLTNRAQYREYSVADKVGRRTPEGWDQTQKSNHPSLFVFAYDWRITNDAAADSLSQFVDVVQKFYPGVKVDIVAHSMGGLVARRYLLKHGDALVDHMITIGSPFLGAAKAVMMMETGEFLPVPSSVDTWLTHTSSTIKRIVQYFPGVHELLPSRGYYALAGSFFGESGQDLNGVNGAYEQYNYNQFVSMMDSRYLDAPGSNNQVFHDTPGQDNWSGDSSQAKYLHIVGRQAERMTITQVNATLELRTRPKYLLFGEDTFYTTPVFRPLMSVGDHTVPFVSALRKNGLQNWNASSATTCVFQGNGPTFHAPLVTGPVPPYDDESVEHTALTQNPRVHDAILTFLKTNLVPPTMSDPENVSTGQPTLTLAATGIDFLSVQDSAGNTNNQINGEFAQHVPGVEYNVDGTGAVQLDMSANQAYTVSFRAGPEPFSLELLRGTDPVPSEARRYRDIEPATTLTPFRLSVSSAGDTQLTEDSDGDGNYETVVPATVSLTGAAANDMLPPTVTLTKSFEGSNVRVTVNATDYQSGVKTVYYSPDGKKLRIYSSPFLVNSSSTPAVYAAADDNAGNRSSLVSLSLGAYGDVNGDGVVNQVDVVAILRAVGGLGSVLRFAAGDLAPKPSSAPLGFGDGKLDMFDVLRLSRRLQGLETSWP